MCCTYLGLLSIAKNNKGFSSLGMRHMFLQLPCFQFQGAKQGRSEGKQTAELTLQI